MTLSGNLTNEEIEQLLTSQYIARLGCCDKGKPYIVPVTYAFIPSKKEFIGVSAEGLKINMIRNNPIVCLEIEKIQDIANWQSVIAWGNFEEIKGADARNVLHDFVKHVTSLINDENTIQVKFLRDISFSSSEDKSDFIVYRIRVSEITGKFEKEKSRDKILNT